MFLFNRRTRGCYSATSTIARRARGCRVLVAAAALVPALVCAGPATAAAAVAGGAYGVRANVNVLLAPIAVGAVPSVTLPAEGGGPFTESLVSANLAGLVPVQAVKVSTQGNSGRGTVESSATVADASVAALVTVSAARSSCSARAGSAEGSASVADLVVAGIPVSTVDVGPNTSITLPVGQVIINEQRTAGSQLTVNAVRIVLEAPFAAGAIVIAQSRCAVREATRTRSRRARAARRARSTKATARAKTAARAARKSARA